MNDTPTEQTNRSLTIPNLPLPSLRQAGKALGLGAVFLILYGGNSIIASTTGVEWITESQTAQLVWHASIVAVFLGLYGNIEKTLRAHGSRITVLAGAVFSMNLIFAGFELLGDVLFGGIYLDFYDGSVAAYVFYTLQVGEDFNLMLLSGAIVLLLLHSSFDDASNYVAYLMGAVLIAVPVGVYNGLTYALANAARGGREYTGSLTAVWLEVLSETWDTTTEYAVLALMVGVVVVVGLLVTRRLDGRYSQPNRKQPNADVAPDHGSGSR